MDDVEMEESVGSDRLSELPKSLILLILSYLSMRDVVSTTFLSKSWENLWTTVPCLNFEDDDGTDRFRNFVNGALIFWEGIRILKFEISIECLSDMSLASHMDLWVRFAVKHNVEELNIHLCREGEDFYKAPRCLNSCSSLTTLSLLGCSLQIHGSPLWNQLKCLKMCESCVSEELINQILLGTPQLEVFVLHFWESNENLNIQSASLKKLRIHKDLFNVQQPLDTVLKICCPNLETLEFVGAMYGKCVLSNVSSLSEAALGFYEPRYNYVELLGETLRQILPSIQHVERLRLSLWCVEVLDSYLKKYLLSPLLNVKLLELDVDGKNGLAVIINLLGIFPNLKMLVIEDRFYNPFVEDISKYSDYLHNIPFVENAPDFNANNILEFKSILGQLKTVDITSFFSHTSIYQIMEFFLKHACKLEKLVIRGRFMVSCGRHSCPQTCFSEAEKVVLNMPRSSPTAKVIFRM